MLPELKKAITDSMFENINDFQLVNNTVNEFRQYIYTPAGEYCVGGKRVSEFITSFDKLLKEDKG